jgi:hypothetical protein
MNVIWREMGENRPNNNKNDPTTTTTTRIYVDEKEKMDPIFETQTSTK